MTSDLDPFRRPAAAANVAAMAAVFGNPNPSNRKKGDEIE
jgi:hypothetical protein